MPRSALGISYGTEGAGEPLVFLHGVTLDGTMWARQVERFASSYRCIVVDRRGHGRSAPMGDAMDEVEDLLSVLDDAQAEQSHLVGHSLGGYDALAFAVRHPNRVKSLALTGPWLPTPEMTWSPPVRTARNEGVVAGRRAWEATPLFDAVRHDPAVWAQVATMVENNDLAIWTRRVTKPEPPTARVHEVAAPTQVIMGELDLEPFHAVGRWLAATVPGTVRIGNGRVITIQGAGHMAPMERPGSFNLALTSFLAEVGAVRHE